MIALGPVARLLARLQITPDSGAEAAIAALARPAAPRVLGFVNAHAVNLCALDAEARRAFMGADVLLRDGAGMKILLRMLRHPPGLNMNGTDLIPRLVARPGLRVAFYGGRPGVAEGAAAKARALGATVVAARHGYASDDAYLRWIERDAPDLLVLGMGMPRQEALALELREVSTAPRLIVCGGAVLDFMAGRVPRAPRWMRRLGLEWAYRLAREPRRLFLRYVLGNPLFLLRAALLAMTSSPAAAAPAATPPALRPVRRAAPPRPTGATVKESAEPAMTA